MFGFVARLDKPIRVAFLLPAGTNRCLSLLGRSIAGAEELAARFNLKPRVDYIDSFKPDLLARELLARHAK